MQDQPRYEPYESTTFYKDGQSSRPLVENTVPRGERFLREDEYFWTGKISSGQGVGGQSVPSDAGSTGGVATGTGTQSGGGGQMTGDVNVRGNTAGGMPGGAGNASSPPGVGGGGSDVQSGPDVFPIQITEEVLLRGQERFNAYCSMCHGATGLGDGMVVRRGFRRPPSLHEDRLQTGDASAAHYFNVITNGWGSMPAYADLVPVEDRWRIIAYIRALQLSQRATLDDVPADQRAPLANGATAEPHGGGPQD
ncbi:MAG: cytochrome c [Acidobacteriota bacterium]|nr:cytochrome c [Acidobacteriota bacterium]